ncbi:hypothetical protein B2J93_2527 [Marssonina coronariae]|uniref:Dol-P-Glc:Glc(2)Man(9)GlcNAc(2)-PP-Dol alpha-1,2-glucosyltransferase n=1 Tax=Diplocarpon coronariae TaxID=2795749 RepID=A0A218Z458_9HELO|nr:hypothetical protein B2J93_2527 [Marssonina coronariae]
MLASSFSTPTIDKVLAWALIGIVILDTPFSPARLFRSFQVSVLVAYAALYGLANFWLGHVTKNVRGPYLDEVFHIPQAQAYCHGRYDVWDPKLTTPPGLYIFASAYAKAVAYGKCTPSVLRSFNVFALVMVFAHYMFYVFRYTILRHPLIRYLAAPVYLICGYLVYLALSSQPENSQPITLKKNSSGHENEPTSSALGLAREPEGPTTSFVIILLATTALSLVTAPLVEPRYFIVPWVIWRLNVPSFPPQFNPQHRKSHKDEQGAVQVYIRRVRFWGWEGYDFRLWLETGWLLLINLVTGYVFLYKGFEWKQEPGNVQRFMW